MVVIFFVVAGLRARVADQALALEAAAKADDDLAVAGKFAALASGETRYLSRKTLLGLPGVKVIRERPWARMEEANLTVVPLSSVVAALAPQSDADAIVLKCSDRWESVLPLAFLTSHEPYLLLLHDGRTPAEGWPMFSRVEGLAPYYVNVSERAFPGFDGVIETGMISATQMIEMRAVNQRLHYAPMFEGSWSKLSTEAAAGRAIFIQRCNNCHQAQGVGGNTSQRPLVLLQTHATLNADFFKRMVTQPKSIYPDTVMPPHNFDEATFSRLIQFLKETHALGAASP